MTFDKTKIIDIIDPVAADIRETVVEETEREPVALFESTRNGRPVTLLEVAENNLSVFPSLLRDSLRGIMFDSYAGVPATWQDWCMVTTSDKLEDQVSDETKQEQIRLL